MNQTPTDTPILYEELCRKSLETVEKIHNDDKNGRINKAQYAYAVDVLWSALAGLVDKDLMIMFEVMGNTPRDGSFFNRTYLKNREGDVVKITNFLYGRVRLEVIPGNPDLAVSEREYDFRSEVGTMQLAKKKELDLIDGLLLRGFQEI